MSAASTSENTPATLALCDRVLPSQPFNRLYFKGTTEQYHQALYDTLARACRVRAPGETFDLETTDIVSVEEMASNPVVLSFLDLLVRLSGARRVLEIGSFIGVSTMTLARALAPEGKVIAIEKFQVFGDICRRNFERNGLADRIELHVGDAAEVLRSYVPDAPLDLAFIDGNKERYLDHFQAVEPLVRSGGLIVVDDILFQGDFLNAEPTTEKGRGVRDFLVHVEQKLQWPRTALPVSDGIMVLQKP